MEGIVKGALERAGYAGTDIVLVVAVSGGPDSLALLHALLSLEAGGRTGLHVAHLNHNFRGEEAEEDARFVGDVARGLGLPATVEWADPIAYQKERGISSFEEAAREVRYDFLGRVASKVGAAGVALGHTADDLAETVLMHIIRGTGIHGLRGMAELSKWRSRVDLREVVLFRPFLGITKGETTLYCQERGISFREDPANLLPSFTRNRIRHELLPAMEKYNPRIREALVRLSRNASLDVDYLEDQVDRVWSSVASEDGDAIALDAGHLSALHPTIRRLTLRRAYQRITGDARRLEEVHLRRMADFVDEPPGKQLVLPRGLKLYVEHGQLILTRVRESSCPYPPLTGEHELELPRAAGEEVASSISGWKISASLVHGKEGQPPFVVPSLDPFTAYMDLEAIGQRLLVRSRLPGERFQPLGMHEEKKIQDFYVDQKVPRSWRPRVPLVVSQRGIAWVVGYRVAEWARVRQDSRSICKMQFSSGG